MKIIILLVSLFFSGCAARTVLRDSAGVKRLETNATAASMDYRGPDGTRLVMIGMDHVAMQTALGNTITQRANGISAIVSAVAASAILK